MSDEKTPAAKADGIGRMTVNNPERRNAVLLEMWDRAEEILKDFAADDPVRVIALTGAGGRSHPPHLLSGAKRTRPMIVATTAFDPLRTRRKGQ